MVFVLFIYYEMSIQNSNLNKMFCAVSQVPCSNWLVAARNSDPDLQPLIDYGNSSITKQSDWQSSEDKFEMDKHSHP